MSRWLGAGMGLSCALIWWAAAPAGVGADEPAPAREVRALIRGGGGLGVSLDEVGADDASRLRLSEERGALVRSVEPDSPAAAAGLQADDVIVGYQGQPVHSAAQLSRMVRETPAGRKVAVDVSRGGATQKLTATLREGRRGLIKPGDFDFDFDFDVPLPAIDIRPPRPPRAPRAPRPPAGELGDFDFHELWSGRRGRLGLTYQGLTDQLARYFKVDGGLLVSSVEEGSPAAAAGVQAGDVIVRANGKVVRSSEDLRGQLDDAEPGAEVTLGLQREGRALEVKAKLAEPDGGGRRVRRRGIRS